MCLGGGGDEVRDVPGGCRVFGGGGDEVRDVPGGCRVFGGGVMR